MWLRIFTLLFFASALTALPQSSIAQTIYRLNPKGPTLSINIPAGSSEKSITAYIVSKGNETEYINFAATGPAGVSVSARSQVLTGKNIARFVKANKRWNLVPFRKSAKNFKSLSITGSSGSSSQIMALSSAEFCQGFTVEDIDEIIRTIASMGVTYTREQVCQIYRDYGITKYHGQTGGGTGRPVDGGITGTGGGTGSFTPTNLASGFALLRKDTCATKKTSSYIVRFDISLARVSAKDRQNGFKIELTASPVRHLGSKASTVKPTSEGKFAPRPLFLLNTTGGFGYGSEEMNVVRWSNRRPRVSNVRIEDYVPYRGLYLARAVADRHLRGGGWATVELLGNSSAYSVCFRMARTRQRVNGYRN